jgi:hypothetical protein
MTLESRSFDRSMARRCSACSRPLATIVSVPWERLATLTLRCPGCRLQATIQGPGVRLDRRSPAEG